MERTAFQRRAAMNRVAAVIALAVSTAAAHAGPAEDADTAARVLAQGLIEGKYSEVVARFDEKMRSVADAQQLRELMQPVVRERAPLKDLAVVHQDRRHDGLVTVDVKATWTHGPASRFQITFAADSRVAGLRIGDATEQVTTREPKVKLRPPFHRTWTAINAASSESNPHYNNPNQRFAIDWVIKDERGRTHRTTGARNEDFYAYGQDALAPADGTIAVVINGVPDNPPGEKDPYNVFGNVIIIEIGASEFAVLAHLIPDSITVRRGQKVVAGELVGRVGNSGHSTEPHLHFEIADNSRLASATSLLIKFERVKVNGALQVGAVQPTEGAKISEAESPK